ncbi:MAG: hypothetical protein GC179_20310 [Anaerolineaceae bacterium]|nr:hypothetical protein [Anaerolineaceae bacterium]
MDNSAARRASMLLGGIMIAAIALSAILPIFTQNASAQQTLQPTDAPTVTSPPVVTDFSGITFDTDYLHPSGLFSVGVPTGWIPGQQTTNATGVEITMNNGTLLSVVQTALQIAQAPVADLDAIDALYTSATLNSSWSNYARYSDTGLNYREQSRTREDNKLIIDFELKNTRGQVFVARQVAWADSDWVYSIRVVTPDNQIDLLKYLMDNIIKNFKPNRIFAGTPADWLAYFDPSTNLIIRYPGSWRVTDSAPGRPTSIDGSAGSLRIQSQSVSAPLDEAAARNWVSANVAGTTVTSAKETKHGELSGFMVAYTYADADGNQNSGLALLLNGANNTLYSVNMRIFEANVDLNVDTAQVSHSDLMMILSTFQLLPGLKVPLPTPTPTVTLPPPSPTLEVTATVEATTEVTAEATAEMTAEPATSTPVPTNTPVPPTNTPVPTNTAVPPSATPVPPTATSVPPTSTPKPSNTPVPPTATSTPTTESTAEVTPA